MSMVISGDNGLTFPAGSTQVQAGNYQSMVNRIINGRMEIDQRNAGAVYSMAASVYTLDRWLGYLSQASKYTVQQNAGSVTPPVGYTNYLGVTSSSAYSITTTDQFFISQTIEGNNIADLAWGTANAASITISFWVRSSLTGTFGGALSNNGASRNYPFSFTISSANTWEQKTITVAGDTSGTWLTNNGVGLRINFNLGTGATYSATAGAWTGTSFITAPTGATSVVGTNGATFYITGVDLRVGSYTVVPQDFRAYGTELQLCQRYYEKNFNQATAPQQGIGPSGQSYGGGLNAFTTSLARTTRIRFAVTKRTNPTITFFRSNSSQGGTTDGLWSWYSASGVWTSSTNTTVTDGVAQDNEFVVELTSSAAYTVTASYLFGGTWVASAEL